MVQAITPNLWRVRHSLHPSNTETPWLLQRPGSRIKRYKSNQFWEADAECKRRNFKDFGIRASTNSVDPEVKIGVWGTDDQLIGNVDSEPFNYSYDFLSSLPDINSISPDLKIRTDAYWVFLSRMDVASYKGYCNDPKVTAAGFVATRLVQVYDNNNKIIAVYIADGEDDGFNAYRQEILQIYINQHLRSI